MYTSSIDGEFLTRVLTFFQVTPFQQCVSETDAAAHSELVLIVSCHVVH